MAPDFRIRDIVFGFIIAGLLVLSARPICLAMYHFKNWVQQ